MKLENKKKETCSEEHVLHLMSIFAAEKSFGGFEVKYEAGQIVFVKDWRGKKY